MPAADPIIAEAGFIGLGVMGQAVAGRILETGQPLRGFDIARAALERFEHRGGVPCPSPAEAVRGLRVAVVMVHDERQVDEVLFGPNGVVGAMVPDAVVWLASTVSPAYVRGLNERLAARGIGLVDGPVSGGVARATEGTLSVFAGAAPHELAIVRPVLARCVSTVFPAGEVGTGSAMKLINQILTASNIVLTAEALALGSRAGIEPGLLIDAISHSAGSSRQFELRAPLMAERDFTVNATIRTFLKDLTIAVGAAEDLGVPAPMAQAARAVLEDAGRFGLLDRSDVALIDFYERDRDEETA